MSLGFATVKLAATLAADVFAPRCRHVAKVEDLAHFGIPEDSGSKTSSLLAVGCCSEASEVFTSSEEQPQQ